MLSGGKIASISADPNVRGLIYAVGTGFYRSTDNGQTWTPAALPPSLGNGGTPSSIYSFKPQIVRADPVHPQRVLVAGVNSCIGFCPLIPEVIESRDAGVTNSRLSGLNTLTPSNSFRMELDPATGNVFVINAGQLLACRNDAQCAVEVTPQSVVSIAFDPASPGMIYAGLTDGSVQQSPDAGTTWNPFAQLLSPAPLLAVSADGVLEASQSADTTDAYLLRYNPDGQVAYGTYFSGGSTIEKTSVMTSQDHLLIAGATGADLPLLDPIQPSFGGAIDAFIAESILTDHCSLPPTWAARIKTKQMRSFRCLMVRW